MRPHILSKIYSGQIRHPGWKSNLGVMLCLLIGWASWAAEKDMETYMAMLSAENLPGLIFILAPIIWTWLMKPPALSRRKDL